ncbi:MAG: TonB-dependent receptor, partial [Pacificimonas sp.]
MSIKLRVPSRNILASGVSVGALMLAGVAQAQTTAVTPEEAQTESLSDVGSTAQDVAGTRSSGISEIVVTAQRQSQSLQDVPISVSAFSAEALDSQQIENSSDLQLTLPNVTFTNGNFTAASFTIRGIGDLCVGVSCDSATAIHINGSPLFGTRLFETEFFDLERIEVLRGPQGTLFGRNATAGVVNIVTAKADPTGFGAALEGEYGNFDSMKVKGMVNIPIGDTLAVRAAGFYLNRDGYTKNLFDGSRVDDRDLYAIRGSVRWEPTDNTSLDLMAYYFREDDKRTRIQKQLCQRDPTGVLGCLAGSRDFDNINNNATFVGTLTSAEFLRSQGIPDAFALGSLYGPDSLSNFQEPQDERTINTAFDPRYFASEQQYQAHLEHDFGALEVGLTGIYQKTKFSAQQDYNTAIQDRGFYAPALNTLAAAAAGAVPGLPASYFAPIANAIIPDGPNGQLCTSNAEFTGTGSFGGFKTCGDVPLSFDRSNNTLDAYSGELIVTSDFDGPFNFLLGGIYAESHLKENSYFVNAFGIDYVSGILGAFTALGAGLPPSYLGTPFFRNNTDDARLKSYGLFGEAYYEVSDTVKLTAGLRYNNDRKTTRARSTLASFLVPFGTENAFESPFVGTFDADAGTDGNQLFQIRDGDRAAKFDEITGRAVIDWQVGDDSLIYASYSRGYKSGGFNPPLQPIFDVQETFTPETIDAFEIGSKNNFLDGSLQLNLTAFYYKYKALQLSRIVARTSVNDNVDAEIYGFEMESVIQPTDGLLVNANFSYLNTKVSSDKFLGNPRDPSGGRDDAVIIKDISNGSNCAVAPTTVGNAAGANGFVNQVNQLINGGAIPGIAPGAGLQGTTPFPDNSGIGASGAFSFCGALAATAPTVGAAFG